MLPVLSVGLLAGCIAPEDRRPGLWLSGEESAFPSDWSFSAAHPEIALEVAAPYFLRHSVTIWCVSVNGGLVIAARDPDTKRWPGWVARNPKVRLGVGDKVYAAKLVVITQEEALPAVRSAYATKYELPARAPGEGPPMRYWRVEPRS